MTTATIGQTVVEVTGEGFPVVMIHGLGGTSNMFQPQLPALSGYRVVRIDLPGSGRSPRPLDPLTMETMCQAVIRAMDGVGAGRAHFVGHSMGTIVCQQIAVQQPQMVASLTLFGALAEPAEATRQGLAARARLARSGGMSDIADQIVANAISAHTRENSPAAVAFVRESITRQDPNPTPAPARRWPGRARWMRAGSPRRRCWSPATPMSSIPSALRRRWPIGSKVRYCPP